MAHVNLNAAAAFGATPCETCSNALSGTLFFALFIISAVGVAGHMNGIVTGGCILGFSIPLALMSLGAVCCPSNPASATANLGNLIMSVVYIIMASLAIAQVVSPITASWVVLGPTLVGLGLLVLCLPCICCTGCLAAAGLASAQSRA